MTVSTTVNRIDYTGNGVTTVFAYPFIIFAASDLLIYVAGVLKTLTTDYTVSNVGVDGGGNVTFLAAPTGAVAIVRNVAATQLSHYVANDAFSAATLEGNLDRLTLLYQQANEAIGRAIKFSKFSSLTGKDIDDITGKDGQFIRVKTGAAGFEMASVTGQGAIGIPVSVANGGTNAATVAGAQASLFPAATPYSFPSLMTFLAGIAGLGFGSIALTSDINFSSTSYATYGGFNTTITTRGGKVLVFAVFPATAVTQNGVVTVSQDGVDNNVLGVISTAAAANQQNIIAALYSPAAGSHSYQLRGKVSAGGGTLTINGASVVSGLLIAMEVSQ